MPQLQTTQPAHYTLQGNELTCFGEWTTAGIYSLSRQPLHAAEANAKSLVIKGEAVLSLDSAGAVLLLNLVRHLESLGCECTWQGFAPAAKNMLNLVAQQPIDLLPVPKSDSRLDALGKMLVVKWHHARDFLDLVGRLVISFLWALRRPKRFQWNSVLSTIENAGSRALPIVGLLTFLIGVVLAYQLGMQLKSFGANIFVVFLSGTAIFREFGPLICAIIVAGRTSSAFTAQIGMMKVSQEIDAMLTMGLSPVDRLALPRIVGMLLVFPFLILWADLLGVMGSMFMAKHTLDISYISFLKEFNHDVSVNSFWIGMSKAPVFALIIATVGCYQGFEVGHSADSVGRSTTQSVVLAIFLIIVADAVFSIIYSLLGI